MAQITVKVRADRGDLGSHFKYGALEPGREVTIEVEEFSADLFERPDGFISPHEQADKARAEELKQSVGCHVYEEPAAPAPEKPRKSPAPAENKEV